MDAKVDSGFVGTFETPVRQMDIEQLKEHNKSLSSQLIDMMNIEQVKEHMHKKLFSQLIDMMNTEADQRVLHKKLFSQIQSLQRDVKISTEVIQEADINTLKQICDDDGISYDESDTVEVIRDKVRKHFLGAKGGGKRRKKRKSNKRKSKRKSNKRKTKKRR